MKKILFSVTVALFAFVFVIANNNATKVSNSKEIAQTGAIIETDVQYVNANEIAAPYTINVPVPAGTVKSVSGPCNANLSDWSVSNGTLSIHYTRRADIECMQDPDIYYIEYVTVEGHKYRAKFISR